MKYLQTKCVVLSVLLNQIAMSLNCVITRLNTAAITNIKKRFASVVIR